MEYRKIKDIKSGFNFEGFSSEYILKKRNKYKDLVIKSLQTSWINYYNYRLSYVYEYVNKYNLRKVEIIDIFEHHDNDMCIIEFVDNGLITCIKKDQLSRISDPYSYINLPDELFTI